MLRRGLRISLPIAVIFLNSAPARGDFIQIIEKPAFDNVQAKDFRERLLIFRGVSGQLLRKPVDQIVTLRLNDFPELTRAEDLAARRDPAADAAFISAARDGAQTWQRELAAYRRVVAQDRAGLFDGAVAGWLELLRDRPRDALSLTPASPNPTAATAQRQAIEYLRAATLDPLYQRHLPAIRRLLLETLIYDELPLDRDGFRPPERIVASPAASRRRGLFADAEPDADAGTSPSAAASVATRRRPQAAAKVGVPADSAGAAGTAGLNQPDAAGKLMDLPSPELSADSWLLREIESDLADYSTSRAVRRLTQAEPFITTGARAAWRLAWVEVALNQGCPEEALAIVQELRRRSGRPATGAESHFVARLRYHEGLAWRALGEPDRARRCFEAALLEPGATGRIYQLAAEAWAAGD